MSSIVANQPKRAALYYPHTHIANEQLLKRSLLLWDEIQVIVPWKGFTPSYEEPLFAEAFELFGTTHYPSDDEKKEAHSLLEDMATRQLPEVFHHQVVDSDWDEYELYPQKLLPETWRMLRDAGIASPTAASSGDVVMSQPAGLTLMSVLADCCAGSLVSRVTDRTEAYDRIRACLAGSSIESSDIANPQQEALISMTLPIIDAGNISLKQLIDFRRREAKSAGHAMRELRHNYLDRINKHAQVLLTLTRARDIAEADRQFRQESDDDLAHLRQELRLEAGQLLGSKEMMTSFAAAAALVANFVGIIEPVKELAGFVGPVVLGGGLMAVGSKFFNARKAVLKRHPMAYLYELKGGLRL